MKKIAINTIEDGICRTILSTYHKVGTFNVFEHNFPAVMELYEEDDIKPAARVPAYGVVGSGCADDNQKQL